jgi:hypothetical protein
MSENDFVRRRILVDFDGVIHLDGEDWQGHEVVDGDPVPGAIEWMSAFYSDQDLAAQIELVIFTARAINAEAEQAIRHWLKLWGFEQWQTIQITNVKLPALVYLDDRGFRFEGDFPDINLLLALKPWHKED